MNDMDDIECLVVDADSNFGLIKIFMLFFSIKPYELVIFINYYSITTYFHILFKRSK